MTYTNQQIRLASRPKGTPTAANFHLTTTAIPTVAAGQILVKVELLSIDPTMRTWMDDQPNYLPPVGIDAVFRAYGIGRVVVSNHPGFAVDDIVMGSLNVQQYFLCAGEAAQDPTHADHLLKIDTQLAPPEVYLSSLGLTSGLTAYFGLLKVGKPLPGETVVVSAAAGSVGSMVGQIAKLKGCRVVGLAGDQHKIDYCVQELGFDACINYKTADIRQELAAACPNGIDIYYDNVGGEILNIALEQIRLHARIVICGAISHYNSSPPWSGPSNYFELLIKRARMEGMLCIDYATHIPEAAAEIVKWMQAGQIKPTRIHVEHGIDQFLPTLLKLFSGENTGKLLLKL